jgi:hypothetical protein
MRAFELTGIKVENIDDARFADALVFFSEGKTLEFENTVLALDVTTGTVAVMKISEHAISDVDSDRASAEILRAQGLYEYLRDSSTQFARIVEPFSPRFSVVFDYGMGAVEVCHLQNGKLVWNT